MKPGILYLIPAPLGESDISWVVPDAVKKLVANLDQFIVEHPKTARQFLCGIGPRLPLQQIRMDVLDEHTRHADLARLLAPLLEGRSLGLLSEAGCPAVADPGANLVRLAHRNNIRVVPLVGPSSILLALMASGLNGERFAFHGYLPAKPRPRETKLAELEKDSAARGETQIFIETPYRNQKLLESILRSCREDSALCVATDVTMESESIATRAISEWKKAIPAIDKRPTIFLLQASSGR